MHRIYESNFEVDINVPPETMPEMIELRNPSGSGVDLRLIVFNVTSESGFVVFKLKRYDDVATHDTPTQQTMWKWDADDPAPSCQVWTATPDAQGDQTDITWQGNTDYEHVFQLDPSDAGDDDKLDKGMYRQPNETLVIPEGTSLSISMPGGQASYIIKLSVKEIPKQPVAHIASAQLPASGSFTAATYFTLPEEWTGLSFLVAYTAHASSTNARPKWRVSWSDGTSDFIQPIVSTTLDTSASPVAVRDQYQLVDRWPTGIAATTTVHFIVPVTRVPGAAKVRIDIAELGDTTNRGTAAVTIVGA